MKAQTAICIMFFAITAISARCQDDAVVTKIEFTSLTRGYQKELFITADSLISLTNDRGEHKVQKRKLADGEWESLLNTLVDINVEEISKLPSPTSRRAFDGARHSTINIITKAGGPWTHSFDDQDPHDSLLPLMEVIKNVAGTALTDNE